MVVACSVLAAIDCRIYQDSTKIRSAHVTSQMTYSSITAKSIVPVQVQSSYLRPSLVDSGRRYIWNWSSGGCRSVVAHVLIQSRDYYGPSRRRSARTSLLRVQAHACLSAHEPPPSTHICVGKAPFDFLACPGPVRKLLGRCELCRLVTSHPSTEVRCTLSDCILHPALCRYCHSLYGVTQAAKPEMVLTSKQRGKQVKGDGSSATHHSANQESSPPPAKETQSTSSPRISTALSHLTR